MLTLGQTVKPAPSPVAYSTSSAVGAITTKPAGKPAPCTTITYSSSVVVPATYTTGVSAGFTITGSSYTTKLVTTVTVPQVRALKVTSMYATMADSPYRSKLLLALLPLVERQLAPSV